MPIEQYKLIDAFGRAALAGNAALFVGAGLSASAGYPSWKDLLKGPQQRADVPDFHDYPLLAEYIANDVKSGGRAALNQHILEAITSPARTPTAGHEFIARLPVNEIWTTNYDTLLEGVCADSAVAVHDDDIRSIGSAPRTIIKMHGSVNLGPPATWAENPVITRTDYERYELDRPRTWALLRAGYLSRTFLFLGFSFTDPNIEILLRLARRHGTAVADRHLTLMKRPSTDPDLRLHRLRVGDLESSGVKVCEIDDYPEIQTVLQRLERRTRPPRVFISGSAEDDTKTEEIKPSCEAVAAELAGQLTWQLTSLGGHAGWQTTCQVAHIRRAEQHYDPTKLMFYFRRKNEPSPPLAERVGTAVYTDLEREPLVASQLADCRALIAIRGGTRTAEEIAWARERGVGVIPLAASGGSAYRDWEFNRASPPELGGRRVAPNDWELLNDSDQRIAARAAVRLVGQAMYDDA